MKKMKGVGVLLVLALVTSLVAVVGLTPSMAQAATPEQIENAIEDGMVWLASQQNADGSWGGEDQVARTGLAVLKFETHAAFEGLNPFDPAYAYSNEVEAGLDYILDNCHNVGIGGQPAGDPDTNGNGIGVKPHCGAVHNEMYETGIALMAISASQSPGRTHPGIGDQAGRRYDDVAQDIIDFIAWAQHDGPPGDPCSQGGWRYWANFADSDNSISGYVTLGLDYASSGPPWGFNLTVPPFVYSELNIFVNNVQDPVNGDTDDGGSHYVPCGWEPVNILKTGNLLSEMAILGDPLGVPGDGSRVQNAIDYMERHWNDPGGDPGWQGNYQACFTTMKGFQAFGIDTFGSPSIDWYDDMSEYIVSTQNADGSWPSDIWGDSQLTTCWAMLTLEKAAPPALELDPVTDTNPPGTNHTVTATYDIAGVPQVNVQIDFEVVSGPNAGASGSAMTNASGQASFTYTSNGAEGTDTIKATAVDPDGTPLVSAEATKNWERHEAIPGLTVWGIIAAVVAVAGVAAFVLRRKLAYQAQ